MCRGTESSSGRALAHRRRTPACSAEPVNRTGTCNRYRPRRTSVVPFSRSASRTLVWSHAPRLQPAATRRGTRIASSPGRSICRDATKSGRDPGFGPKARNARESTSRSTMVAARRDARPARGGSGHHAGHPADAMSCRQGTRAGRLQDLPDGAPPTGAHGTARLLPGGERHGPLHALSPLPGPVSRVTSEVSAAAARPGVPMN